MAEVLDYEGRSYLLDGYGHLQDAEQWTRSLGQALALQDGLELNEDHWWIVDYVRHHQHSYGTPPLTRVLIKAWREHRADSQLGSRELYRLFPDNPVRQACKYGGLPPPDWCI